MSFKVGDHVQVKKSSPSHWIAPNRIGKITRIDHYQVVNGIEVEFGEANQIGYVRYPFYEDDLVFYEFLPEGELERQSEENLPKLLETLELGLRELLPLLYWDSADLIVSLYNGRVTIQPAIFESVRIGGIKQLAGWSVSEWNDSPAQRGEPWEDVSDKDVGGPYQNYGEAVKVAIEAVFRMKSKDFWNSTM